VVAGSADHICPWRNCRSSTRLLGGTSRFVLSSGGHIAALINPPAGAKSSYQVDDGPAVQGSWWPDYAAWLKQRGGEQVAPPTVASLGAAPGRYVLET